MPNPSLVSALARSFLAGEPTLDQVVARATHMLGRPWPWLPPLARRYLARFAGTLRPTHREVVRFLTDDPPFRRACRRHRKALRISHWLTEPQQMLPVPAAASWDLPAIESAGALAAWLALTPGELDWFADLKSLTRSTHYHYRVLDKSGGRIRIIEAPQPRLKALQRQILSGILEQIPPHAAAHGFVKARSIKTFIAPHTGQLVVLRMDLRDFFPSIPAARIRACFRTMGYPESVANLLTGLCTNVAPTQDDLYSRPHLPQGAPTSPALANFCLYRSDCRLAGLAAAAGANFTRYADDLAFSGSNISEALSIRAAAILLEEGFDVHHRKTRIMRQGVRQHLAGLVANQHMNVMRPDYDRLKATLTNCLRHGPETQNRDAHDAFQQHLQGRVAFVESINPAKGKRLRAILEKIEWPSR